MCDDYKKKLDEFLEDDSKRRKLSLKDQESSYLPLSLIEKFSSSFELSDPIEGLQNSNSDLKTGIYEGGFKVWECTQDLIIYLLKTKNDQKRSLKILDVGCGGGLLGICCLLNLDPECVHFQDFNSDVLRYSTYPNVITNIPDLIGKCRFLAGDWKDIQSILSEKYDLILTSETIYNEENYPKLVSLFSKVLEKDGQVLIGAKVYYFGVGGGVDSFTEFVEQNDLFDIENLETIEASVARSILRLMFK